MLEEYTEEEFVGFNNVDKILDHRRLSDRPAHRYDHGENAEEDVSPDPEDEEFFIHHEYHHVM